MENGMAYLRRNSLMVVSARVSMQMNTYTVKESSTLQMGKSTRGSFQIASTMEKVRFNTLMENSTRDHFPIHFTTGKVI
jgi:hypothetical protein